MARLQTLLHTAQRYRPLLRLALLALGLMAISLGGGAPDCFPDSGCP
jgi:hypothetical protein